MKISMFQKNLAHTYTHTHTRPRDFPYHLGRFYARATHNIKIMSHRVPSCIELNGCILQRDTRQDYVDAFPKYPQQVYETCQ